MKRYYQSKSLEFSHASIGRAAPVYAMPLRKKFRAYGGRFGVSSPRSGRRRPALSSEFTRPDHNRTFVETQGPWPQALPRRCVYRVQISVGTVYLAALPGFAVEVLVSLFGVAAAGVAGAVVELFDVSVPDLAFDEP